MARDTPPVRVALFIDCIVSALRVDVQLLNDLISNGASLDRYQKVVLREALTDVESAVSDLVDDNSDDGSQDDSLGTFGKMLP